MSAFADWAIIAGMILVGHYDSPFVRRVAVTLHHYHMPFTRNPLSVFSDEKEMRKINPLLRVPALILEDGEILIDSHAIIDHLDQVAGGARALTPAHGPERRKVMRGVAMATGCMDKVVSIFFERRYHAGKALSKEWEGRCMSQLTESLERLEHDCGTPWFDDNRMTQTDVTLGCMIGHMKMRVPEAFPADKFPKLHALALHCETREEFVKSRPGPDDVMPARKAKS